MDEYEVLVIGSGPAGQKAAIAASKLGRRAAIIERADMLGGVCVNTGTIPSKTMRESVLHLTGMRHREHYGTATGSRRTSPSRTSGPRRAKSLPGRWTSSATSWRATTSHFSPARHGSTTRTRWQSQRDPRVARAFRHGDHRRRYPPGSASQRALHGRTVVDSDGVLALERIPASLVVVGAGVVGVEYASVFAALGTKVTVVESRADMLDFCDEQVVEALRYHLRDLSVTFRFGETVAAVDITPTGR